jgi:predicted kinase
VNRSLALPADALVLLIGPSGSGKTTFAARHFARSQVLSSDALREMIADDPTDQSATDDAFTLLHEILAMRLRRGRLTVVDATNLEVWARAKLLDAAWQLRRPGVAIVLDVGLEVCLERNATRRPRPVPPATIRRQHRWLRDSLLNLPSEGFAAVHHLASAAEVDAVRVERGASRRGPGG